MARKALKFDPDEIPERSAEDLKDFRSLKEDMPEVVAAFKRGRGRPALGDAAKVRVSLRLPPAVVAAYKATGGKWQQVIGNVLAKHAPLQKKGRTSLFSHGEPLSKFPKPAKRNKKRNIIPTTVQGKSQHKQH